jgi:hypothetical protein
MTLITIFKSTTINDLKTAILEATTIKHYEPGTEFTTLHFIRNLQIGPISESFAKH